MSFQTLSSLFILILCLLSFLLGLREAGHAAPRMDPGDKTAKTDTTSRGELDAKAWLNKSITYGACLQDGVLADPVETELTELTKPTKPKSMASPGTVGHSVERNRNEQKAYDHDNC